MDSDKFALEVMKVLNMTTDFKFGVWINPV